MVKIYSAFTKEIDNPESAAREIMEQLKPAENAMKNCIGIIHFYHEYAETGALKAVTDALPFETVGCVSSYIGMHEQHGDIALSVTMITGDDMSFDVRTVDNAASKSREQIIGEVTRICSGFLASGKPKVVIPLISLMQNFSGDDLVETANAQPEFIPMFGTVTFNMDKITSPHYVWGKGKLSTDMHVFVALYGPFEPNFRITSSFAFDETFTDAVEITEADGAILKTVNGIAVLEYLKKLGMVTNDNVVTGTYGIWIIPAILTYPDGTRVVRAFPGVVEGTGYIQSTGTMKAGAKIKFAHLDGDKTLASAAKLFNEITGDNENNVLAYSCVARAWSLGSKYSAEAQKISECSENYRDKNSAPLNYCVAYSGGEICPIKDKDGKFVNAMHNYTLASCSFG